MKASVMAAAWLLLGGALLTQEPLHTQASPSPVARHRSQLISFTLQRPSFVAVGSYLSRVQVCGVSSGTGVDPDSCNPLGEASRETPAGKHERWVFTYPPYPVNYMVTEIYARAYGSNGKVVGQKSLGAYGVSGISEAMYPSADPKLFSRQDRIGVEDSGKTFVFADNMFPFSIVLDKTKYPASDLIVDCTPKYNGKIAIIASMTAMEQQSSHLPGSAFYTATPGQCAVRNHDFSVTIKVLHGDWRD